MLRALSNEVELEEKSGMWPLSSFAPFKERESFPGFEDYSPEEMRWDAYQAQKQGTVMEFRKKIEDLYQAARLRKNCIKNPDSEVSAMIERIYRGQKLSTTPSSFSFSLGPSAGFGSNQPSAFGGTSVFGGRTGSIFGSQNQPAATASNFTFSLPQLGGQGSSPTSVFGGGAATATPSVFGAAPSSNMFGTTAMTGQSSSIFGGPTSSTQNPGTFGSGNQTAGILGSSPFAAQTSSIFGAPPVVGSGIGSSPLLHQPQPPAFNSSQSMGQTLPAFGASSNSASVFSSAGQTTSVFGQNQPPLGNSPMNQNRTQIDTGGQAIGNAAYGQAPPTASVFGGGLAQPVNSFHGTNTYTPLSDLTDPEKEQYGAQTFTVGKIPLRPPPKELCM